MNVRRARQRAYKEELDRQVLERNNRPDVAKNRHLEMDWPNTRLGMMERTNYGNTKVQQYGADLASQYEQQYGLNHGNRPAGLQTLINKSEDRFQYLSKAFLSADRDRSGFLDVQEIRKLCDNYNIPNADVDEILRYADVSGDGRIAYAEFTKRLARQGYPGQTKAPMRNMFPGTGGGGLASPIRTEKNLYPSRGILPAGVHLQEPRNNLDAMWNGRPESSEARGKVRKKQQWLNDLARQVEERKQREKMEKLRDRKAESLARDQATAYNPWGRGGGGAPLRDDDGHIVTDLREINGAGKTGGVSPKFNRAKQSPPRVGYSETIPMASMQNGHGAHENRQEQYQRHEETGRIMTPPGGYGRMAYLDPNQAREIQEAEKKRNELRQTLRVQMELKKRQKQLELERAKAEERREEERVERERQEILNAYQREHRDNETKKAEKNAVADAEKVKNHIAARSQKKRGMVDDIFATTKDPPRTPPGQGSDGGNNTNPNTVGIGRLRRDLNKQHEALLSQLAEQRTTIAMLQKQLQEFYKGDTMAAVSQEGRGMYGGSPEGVIGSRSEFISYSGSEGKQPMSPTQPSFHINMDEPDELDALLTAFVHRKSVFSRSAKKLR